MILPADVQNLLDSGDAFGALGLLVEKHTSQLRALAKRIDELERVVFSVRFTGTAVTWTKVDGP